jgi:hypothetical protein
MHCDIWEKDTAANNDTLRQRWTSFLINRIRSINLLQQLDNQALSKVFNTPLKLGYIAREELAVVSRGKDFRQPRFNFWVKNATKTHACFISAA